MFLSFLVYSEFLEDKDYILLTFLSLGTNRMPTKCQTHCRHIVPKGFSVQLILTQSGFVVCLFIFLIIDMVRALANA